MEAAREPGQGGFLAALSWGSPSAPGLSSHRACGLSQSPSQWRAVGALGTGAGGEQGSLAGVRERPAPDSEHVPALSAGQRDRAWLPTRRPKGGSCWGKAERSSPEQHATGQAAVLVPRITTSGGSQRRLDRREPLCPVSETIKGNRWGSSVWVPGSQTNENKRPSQMHTSLPSRRGPPIRPPPPAMGGYGSDN